jgi:hypothetical protein
VFFHRGEKILAAIHFSGFIRQMQRTNWNKHIRLELSTLSCVSKKQYCEGPHGDVLLPKGVCTGLGTWRY